jgi:hypothetical protein
MVHHPVAVIVQKETVERRPLIVKVVAYNDRGGACQLFPPKHLLQIAVGTVFLERNVDFHQPTCTGYKY